MAAAEEEHALETKCGTLLFANLCETLERVKSTAKVTTREKLKLIFSPRRKEAVGRQSWFPLVRLVCPESDNVRARFNLKEKTVAAVYADVLVLNPEGDAGKKLGFHTGAKAGGRRDFVSHDVALTIEEVLTPRVKTKRSKWTLADVNAFLDQLATLQGCRAEIKALLATRYTQLSPMEHKWLVRIICREIHLGFKIGALLKNVFHPEAHETYAKISDLRRICADYAEGGPGHALAPGGTTIELGQAFKPMRAAVRIILSDT